MIEDINDAIHSLELEHFFQVKPVLLTGHTESEKVFVAINGRKVKDEELSNISIWLVAEMEKATLV